MPKENFSDRFYLFANALQKHVLEMVKGETHLFKTSVTKEELWDNYLKSFPEGTNPVFRERGEFDCVYCKQFIRPCGNIVAIKDNSLISIWDIEGLEYPFDVVAKSMSDLVKSKPIEDVLVTREHKFGTEFNKQQCKDGSILTWHHFYMDLPKALVINEGASPESVMAEFRSSKEVFERALKELTLDAAISIMELIDQGSLYRGDEHKKAVNGFIKFKKEYEVTPEASRNAWLWKTSINNPISRIRNTAIGTLLVDLSNDMDLDEAVAKFEKVMAPSNYKRPKAIFTKRMVEEAEKTIAELGMENSLGRRHAKLDDITVNNVIFVNKDARKKMEGGSILSSLKEESSVVNPRSFNKVEEIAIVDFLEKIVPTSKRIELLMESRLQSNMVSLIAPKEKESKSLFKWNNNFSWSYISDTTDSMKQLVKQAGGNVEGVLRFSIQWNDDRGKNQNDYDAHCIEPKGFRIYYMNRGRPSPTTGGNLDVDIRYPGDKIAVENITWQSLDKMAEGMYEFKVHNYSHNGGTNGFDAEIEFDGQIHSFSYHKDLKQSEFVTVAKVEYKKSTGFRIVSSLEASMSTKDIWGITTNKWVDVETLMFSPNYWDEQKGTGNRHYLFMLNGCINATNPRGFYNEFLNEELVKHKRVFEALGAKTRVDDSAVQLSGLGFSDTQRNSVYARVEGSFTRILKINF